MISGCSPLYRWQKKAGFFAALFFLIALLALVDALRGGMSGNRGIIELLPGSSYAISGPMPPRTDTIEEMVVTGTPADGSVRLAPKGIFSGFWFGGSMWRGTLEVSSTAQQAEYRIQVKDRFGEKQNPALLFTVRIWPDQKTLNAHSFSFLIRTTGINPFVFVLTFTFCGILTGGATFLLGRRWTLMLHKQACSEIYRLTTSEQGTELHCDRPPATKLALGSTCLVYCPHGKLVQSATVVAVQKRDVVLLIESDNKVRIGDVVCLQETSKIDTPHSQKHP